MIRAGILVRVRAGKEREVAEALRKIEEARYVIGVFGRWDLVVMVEAKDLDELARIVVEKIRAVDGVETTETLVAASF